MINGTAHVLRQKYTMFTVIHFVVTDNWYKIDTLYQYDLAIKSYANLKLHKNEFLNVKMAEEKKVVVIASDGSDHAKLALQSKY